MRRGIVMVEKAIRAFARDRNHNITQKKAERRERRGCLPSYSGELEACSMMDDVRTTCTPALRVFTIQLVSQYVQGSAGLISPYAG